MRLCSRRLTSAQVSCARKCSTSREATAGRHAHRAALHKGAAERRRTHTSRVQALESNSLRKAADTHWELKAHEQLGQCCVQRD